MNHPSESTYRRRYPRISINFPAHYSLEAEERGARGLVLGGGGLFLDSIQELHENDVIRVQFQPSKLLPQIRATARVRYQIQGKGLGAEFTEIGREHREMILRLIQGQMEERRKYPRAAFSVEVVQKGGPTIGLTTDMSEGGLFVETERPAKPGATIPLWIHLGLGESEIEATAEVLYSVLGRGMGLHFVELKPEDRERLLQFIAKRR